jgi:kynurenine formamidase
VFHTLRIWDLTLTLSHETRVWPGDRPVEISKQASLDREGYNTEFLCLSSHSGTHVDSPYHFLEEGCTVDQIPLDRLVIQVRVLRPERIEGPIGVEELRSTSSPGLRGKGVLISTGWNDSTRQDPTGFPGLTPEAGELLVREGVKLLGVDFPSVDPYHSRGFPVHTKLLSTGVVVVEDLCCTSTLNPEREYLLVALPLKLRGGSGAMARVIALEWEG